MHMYMHTQVRDLLCAPAENEGKKFSIVAGEHGGMAVADLVRVPVANSADIDKLMRSSCVPDLSVCRMCLVCLSCRQYAPTTAPRSASHTHDMHHTYTYTCIRRPAHAPHAE